MVAKVIYLLCAATSLFCFVLLFRAWARSRTRLLLWSSASFLFFAISNILLVADLLIYPGIDMSFFRTASNLVAILLLLLGLILCS